jgi:hypothetical protein
LTVETAFEVSRLIPDARLILSGMYHAMEPDTPLVLVFTSHKQQRFAEVGTCYVYKDMQGEWNSVPTAVFESNYEEVE